LDGPVLGEQVLGNILLSSEGIAARLVEELQGRCAFPSNVEVLDGGTAALDLLPLIEEVDHLVVVDAVDAEALPGTLFRFARQESGLTASALSIERRIIFASLAKVNICSVLL